MAEAAHPVKWAGCLARGVSASMEVPVSSDLSHGSVFAGRYRVERRIAAGGMGAVYEVVHIETNRRRALKVMHAHYVSSDELRGRFRQEARVAAEIESDHIVDVFDAGIDEATGMPFLVMEFLRGEELGKRLKRTGALPPDEVVRYLYETSLALDKTHKARIVHRDLKPDNLFLCERDHGPPRVKVLDFGIAKIVSDASTQANATSSLGTPMYMAPEQFSTKSGVSPATDIFALGMIAFTLLVGKPYWLAESKAGGGMMAFAMDVAMGPQESPVARARQQFGIALPNEFDPWFFRATARDPRARFATAIEAVMALAAVLGVPVPGDGIGTAPRASLPSISGAASPGFTPVQSTLVLQSASGSGPVGESPTGPTLMGMTPTPIGHSTAPSPGGASSRLLVLVAVAATLVVGLGGMLVVKVLSSETTEQAVESPKQAAASTPSAPSGPVIAPVESVAAPEPVASAAAAPSSSEQAPAVKAPPPSVPGQAVTKTSTAPVVTTSKPVVKKSKASGEWIAD